MRSIKTIKFLLPSIVLLLFGSNFATAQIFPNVAEAYPKGTVTPILPADFISGIKVNYVRTTIPTSPIINESDIQPTDFYETRVKTEYMDGLGRLIQTVNHFASPSTNDLVEIIKYDNMGRDAYHFLPYAKEEASANDNGKFKLTAYSDQKNFYKNTLGYTADDYFYTQTNYEASPLNRVIKALPQGSSWVGNNRGTTLSENPLPAGANVRLFTIAYAPGSLPTYLGLYNKGDLMVKTTTDEDKNFTEEYITKDNHVVLKTTGKTGNAVKLQTYYVYDDFGLLRYVISPKATLWLAANNWTLNASIAAELCFSYEYDGRLRPIVKTTPGAGAEWMVYNLKDELIFSQTPTQRTKGEWVFNKYDVLGRLIQTGIYYNVSSQAVMQNYANAPYTGADPLLLYLFNDIYGNTTYVNTFTTATVYTTNYYDDYSFTVSSYNPSYMSSLPDGWNTVVSAETTNMLTGTKTFLLDGASTPVRLLSINYYNDRGLLLQTQTQNHKGGWNIITNSYDFLGQKLGTYTELNNPAATDNATIKTVETFYYDHAGRVVSTSHNLNDLYLQFSNSNYNFDELGRLKNKNFSNQQVPTIEYEYNVRGWLTSINKDYCLTGAGSQTFGMELSYNYGYTRKYYNGSIAGMKWRNSGNSSELRSYGYGYDTYNRLKEAFYTTQTGVINPTGGWSVGGSNFSASNMAYDENGNIQSMKHRGVNIAGQSITLDDLSYGYAANSNKLLSVSESASSQSKDPTAFDNLGDFRDVPGANDYTYDENGNLLTDANKSLSFTYDEIINKTKRVSKGGQQVDYLYDASGNKLQKKVSGGNTTTTDYIGAAVYINNSLSFIAQPEGRIRYNPTGTAKYMYDYYIKDHLGSTRSVVTYTDGNIAGIAKSTTPAANEVKYIATSEPDLAAKENQLFDNVDNTRSVKLKNKTVTDNYVAKLSGKNSKTILGPDITLKVMAGDTVKISAEALYIAEKNNPTEVAKNVINNFITAFTTLPSMAAEGANALVNSSNQGLANAILNMQRTNATNGAPKAFLNYLLYDEYMNLIPEGSGALQVKNKDDWQTLQTDKIPIPQNGFIRVFSSNMETAPVSINNTTLVWTEGQLVEEYNYYPYGLVFNQSSASGVIKKTVSS
ncbi:MAG: DUF6443 domain-containing protein [Bacteroidia bacterium]